MSEPTTEVLQQLREQIDQTDQQLLALIRKRLDLVAAVGVEKHKSGVPIYAPAREASMLKKRRSEAEKMNISPDAIEDILRRLMRESYLNEKDVGFKQVKAITRPIVIVGGYGQLGGLFGDMLSLSGYNVVRFGSKDWPNADKIMADAAMVIVSVPIHKTEAIIKQLPTLPQDCILTDLTSIKSVPLQAMLDVHHGPVLGLHPMFGPDVGSLAKQLVVTCDGRNPEAYAWFLQQMTIWGAQLLSSDAKEHDQNMQLVQAMRHFSSFVYGYNLYKSNANVDELLKFSSPIYRLELAMVGRLFAQNPALYADIIFAQSASIEAIDGHHQRYQEALAILKSGDREAFIETFNEVKNWFGDFAAQFQKESRNLLLSAHDQRVRG